MVEEENATNENMLRVEYLAERKQSEHIHLFSAATGACCENNIRRHRRFFIRMTHTLSDIRCLAA